MKKIVASIVGLGLLSTLVGELPVQAANNPTTIDRDNADSALVAKKHMYRKKMKMKRYHKMKRR
jgi:hypothetical protein